MSIRRIVALCFVFWIAATAATFVASPHGGSGERRSFTLTATAPAAGADTLTLVLPGGYHTVEVKAAAPGAPDAVEVTVSGRVGNGLAILSKPLPALENIAVDTRTAGGTLTVGLTRADTTVIRTNWTITVPARFGAHVTADAGSVRFTGLEGPLTGRVDVGAVRADVASHHGPADLDAVVGRVSVSGNGLGGRRPRGEAGPGAHWDFPAAGSGGPPISLHVSVGSAALRVR